MSRQIRYGLSTRKIEALTTPGSYADGGGLYLAVGPRSKSWIFRYQFRGRRRDMGLGSVRWVTLSEARHLAHEAHRVLTLERADPLDKRRAAEAVAAKEMKIPSFEECMRACMETLRSRWSPAHERNWETSMRMHVIPVLGKLPVGQIKIEHLAKLLTPLRSTKPKLSKDLQVRIGAVLDHAIGNGWYTGENPAKLKYLNALLPAAAESKPHEALDYRDIPALVAELRSHSHIACHTTEFLILSGLRLNEVRLAQWKEFNLDERIWTVPADRMKGRRGKKVPHEVPLSSAMMTVINRMAGIRQNDFVFAGGASGAISESTLTRELKKLRPDVTLHGFRATFSTYLNRVGFPSEMVEHALAHSVGTTVKRAYDRQTMVERRREMMEVWADYCAGIEPGQNVVPLRA